jgi:AsmA protein
VALIGVLVIIWFVDPNRFKPRIESAVRARTGREFTLVGDIELRFMPWLALRTGAGRIGNAPGFGPEPMATWQSARVGAKLFPLLRGELVADRVQLIGADVRLIRHADGHANWEGLGGSEPAAATPAGRAPSVEGVAITDSRVSFVDETVPRRIEITGLNLSTDTIVTGEPFTDSEVSGVLHMDDFTAAGVPFKVTIPRAVVAPDYSRVEVKEYSVSFGGFEAQGAVSGTLGAPTKLAGTIKSNEFDPRALLSAVGIDAPKTTDVRAFGKLGVAASWAFDRGAIGVDPLSLTLDDTHFTGTFRRAAGDDPVGEFTLRGDALDIARYIPPPDPASEPFVLPTATLKALKFRGQLELGEATLDDIVMKGVTLRLLLDDQGLRGEARP